jgi:hypothetical protein
MENKVFEECASGNHDTCPKEITASSECPNDGVKCACPCHRKPRSISMATISITPHDSG